LFVSFDEPAAFEAGADSDEGKQMRCVENAPPGSRGLDQLERQRQARGPRAGPLGDLGPVAHRREGRLEGYLGPEGSAVV
jgi:hypothetical protein